MSNGTDQQYNCILEICCGGDDSAKRVRAFLEMMHHELGPGPHSETDVIRYVFRRFDLMKKGLLGPMVAYIAKQARDFPYE